jgi:hypothetical protein
MARRYAVYPPPIDPERTPLDPGRPRDVWLDPELVELADFGNYGHAYLLQRRRAWAKDAKPGQCPGSLALVPIERPDGKAFCPNCGRLRPLRGGFVANHVSPRGAR